MHYFMKPMQTMNFLFQQEEKPQIFLEMASNAKKWLKAPSIWREVNHNASKLMAWKNKIDKENLSALNTKEAHKKVEIQ